eukprot:m.229915 g.229915  ORF g.229915 m.229915 type:complete len:926 (+) comp26012_c0_seq4:2418-5195(+)
MQASSNLNSATPRTEDPSHPDTKLSAPLSIRLLGHSSLRHGRQFAAHGTEHGRGVMGITGLTTLLTDTSDATVAWVTRERYTVDTCPPVVVDANGFKFSTCEADNIVSAGLWRLGGGYQLVAAELNRRLDALASVAPEIHIVVDGVAPTSKQTELEARLNRRADSEETMRKHLAAGHPDQVKSDHAKRVRKIAGAVLGAFVERHRGAKSRARPDRPFVTEHRPIGEGDPMCAHVAVECGGVILANDSDFAVLNTPLGYLMLDHWSMRFATGELSGIRASPDQLLKGLNVLLAGLPSRIPGGQRLQMHRKDLPQFAALMGCDQTQKHREELRAFFRRRSPCSRGLLCGRSGCKYSHDQMLLARYPCNFGMCTGGCGLSHDHELRQQLFCHVVANGERCPHRACYFSTRPPRRRDTVYHLLQRGKKGSPGYAERGLIARAALVAAWCADNGPAAPLAKLTDAVAAAMAAYNLADPGDADARVRELWRSHPQVWSSGRGGPRCSLCSVLTTWTSDQQHQTPPNPRRAPWLPADINEVSGSLMELATRVELFWSAELPPDEWHALARPDLVDGGSAELVWRPPVTTAEPYIIPVADAATAHRCDWMPDLTAAQEADRPLLKHVKRPARTQAVLLAAGIRAEQCGGFAAHLAGWTAEAADMGISEPPEELVVALWTLRQNWKLTSAELAAVAEIVVCTDADRVIRSAFVPKSDTVVGTSCWREECCRPAADRAPCTAAPTDFGSEAWLRREDIAAAWTALVEDVKKANRALGLPLIGGAEPPHTDGAVVHTVLARACAAQWAPCTHARHATLTRRLVALVAKVAWSRPATAAAADGADGAAAPRSPPAARPSSAFSAAIDFRGRSNSSAQARRSEHGGEEILDRAHTMRAEVADRLRLLGRARTRTRAPWARDRAGAGAAKADGEAGAEE